MIFRFLAVTSPLVFILPTLVSLRNTHDYQLRFRIISLHVWIAFIIEMISYWLWMHKQSNLFLLHLYTILEFEIISLFYLILLKEYSKKWVIPTIMICFAVFAIIDSLFFHDLNHFNVFARSTECLIIISYAIYYLYKHLITSKTISLKNDPILLINTAFLFYFSISFFLFLFSNYIMAETFKTYVIWTMHSVALWIYYTTIGIALWKAGKK